MFYLLQIVVLCLHSLAPLLHPITDAIWQWNGQKYVTINFYGPSVIGLFEFLDVIKFCADGG